MLQSRFRGTAAPETVSCCHFQLICGQARAAEHHSDVAIFRRDVVDDAPAVLIIALGHVFKGTAIIRNVVVLPRGQADKCHELAVEFQHAADGVAKYRTARPHSQRNASAIKINSRSGLSFRRMPVMPRSPGAIRDQSHDTM